MHNLRSARLEESNPTPNPRRVQTRTINIKITIVCLAGEHKLCEDRIYCTPTDLDACIARIRLCMNILLPLGKLRRTLDSDGYDKPLQLTLVLGRPVLFWLLDSLRFDEENDTVWVIVSARDESTYNIFSALSAEYRAMKVAGRLRFVPLYYSTRGVAETLHITLKYMSPTDLVKKTLCVNGDMLFNPEICVVSRTIPSNSAVCFLASSSELFVDEQIGYEESSRWCYCEVQQAEGESKWELNCSSDHVLGSCNIVRITDDSLTRTVMMGAYAFGSAHLLQLLTEKAMKAAGTAYNGENLGFPDLFQVGIDSKDQNIFGVPMSGLSCTPLKCTVQLEHFINSAPSLNISHVAKASTRYLFQMYGGILNDRDEPRKHVVDVMQKLKCFGHHIIVSSSRGRGAAAVKELIDKLELFAICYDEIELHDDDRDYTVMVGSYVCDIRGDLHKALGIPGDSSLKLEAIPPRHFNRVIIADGSVTKTSNVESLAGEAFYYENIPKQLQYLFPEYLSKNSDNNGNLSIEISKVEGITFSQLMVNRCVDEARLQCLLRAITESPEMRNLGFISRDACSACLRV